MKTVEQYKQQQTEAVKLLRDLLDFLEEGSKFINRDNNSSIENLKESINYEETKKLRVALIGGFSEGKTSIAAAWSGNYDKSTMKINQAESTDYISVYELENLDLIDTPGLYGYKENEYNIEYKKITKDYVSSANLVLYVVNPNNPIKESHRDELIWLFKELNLLARTVFVISRFDEEVDIEDEDDYQDGLLIKKENIQQRLRDFNIIGKEQRIPVVAVSANPFGEGLEHWLQNMDEYKKISRIESLQNATTKLIKESGGNNSILLESQGSVVKDIFLQKVPEMDKYFSELSDEIEKQYSEYDNLLIALSETRKTMRKKIAELRNFSIDLFTDLIIQVKGTEIETFNEFVERNIGDEGIVLDNTILNEFERQLNTIEMEVIKIETNFNNTIEHFNKTISNPTKNYLVSGGQFLKSGKININSGAILKVRDVLMPNLKFKPWGATKLAGGITKGMSYAGLAIDISLEAWDSYSKYKKMQEFNQVVIRYVENFEKQRNEFVNLMQDEKKFSEIFFPSLLQIQENVYKSKQELEKLENNKKDFIEWKDKGLEIKNKFEDILQDNK